LAALSGTTPKGSKRRVFGSVWVDVDVDVDRDSDEKEALKFYPSISSGNIALLQQHDAFFGMLTVKETVALATFLQLDMTQREQDTLAGEILDSLGLTKVQNHRIGEMGGKSGGLSGGERRRVSVALELVSNPQVFIADEPTTGLDSSQAQKVFHLIAQTAKDRHIPCICTIHQPRASIWKKIESFLLLAPNGRTVYLGKRSNAIAYFAKLGYKCPRETTPAEFFLDLVTVDSEDEKQAEVDEKRIEYLVNEFELKQKDAMVKATRDIWSPPENGNGEIGPIWERRVAAHNSSHKVQRRHRRLFWRRWAALLQRSLRQNLRNVKVNTLRSLASLGLARLFSELFSGVKKGTSLSKSVADRTAILSFGVINMAMMSIMKTLNLFGKERSVVSREQMRRHYTSFDYLLSKTLAELPLDVCFSSIFAATLKHFTCLRSSFGALCGTFSLMTVAAASLGFAIGSFTDGVEEAMTLGMPVMVVLMAVGIINPSGVDTSVKKSLIIQCLQRFSPIGMAIESLVVAEYKGMKFDDDGQKFRLSDLPKMGGLALVRNGDQVVDALGLSNRTYKGAMQDLARISVVNLLLSWIGLSVCGGSNVSLAQGDESPILDAAVFSDNIGTIIE